MTQMTMHCALCNELDGLLFDLDLIVYHLAAEHDITVNTEGGLTVGDLVVLS